MEREDIFFSIVIPFFNRINFLEEAIESILNQTIQNYEIILIDDGSCEKINEKILNNKKVKYFYQENSGPASARNFGIEKAIGKYIVFLDADDLFEKSKLEKTFKYILNNPKAKIIHTSYELINYNKKHIKYINSGFFEGDVYKKIIYRCPIATPTIVLKREIFDEFKFDEKIRIGEDTILWTRICKENKLYSIKEPLTKVRIHGKNSAYNIQDIKIGGNTIIMKNMEYDEKLDLRYKLKKLSCINYCLAKNSLNKKKFLLFCYYILKGIVLCPFNLEVLRGRKI